MKYGINLSDYRSYRRPFLFEFIPGFKYEYLAFSVIKPYLSVLKSNTNIKCKILHKYKNKNLADVEFYINGKTIFTPCYCLNYINISQCREITQHWKQGIWGTTMGIQDKKHLERMIQDKQIIKELPTGYLLKCDYSKSVGLIDFKNKEELIKFIKDKNLKIDYIKYYNKGRVSLIDYKQLGGEADEERTRKITRTIKAKKITKIQLLQKIKKARISIPKAA